MSFASTVSSMPAKPWNRRRLTFELTGTLRRANFGLGFRAQNWTAAKCPVERRVRRRGDGVAVSVAPIAEQSDASRAKVQSSREIMLQRSAVQVL